MSFAQMPKEKKEILKRDLVAVYYAYRHPRVGLVPKILIFLALAYALSPIDLIPDFIPVIGLLDDILIVPFLIYLSLLFIPAEVMRECRERAAQEPPLLGTSWITAAVIVAIWLLLAYAVFSYFFSARAAGTMSDLYLRNCRPFSCAGVNYVI